MKRFSSLRVRLVGIVFLAIAPALGWLAYTHFEGVWPSFLIGLCALCAAWLGGELFILRQVQSIRLAAKKLASGDLSSRTGLMNEPTELGDLARTIDTMAATLERQIQERERTEQSLLDRAHQQTVIAALGQFALVTSDFSTLLNQAAMLVAQTLEVEYCLVLELSPDAKTLLLRAGVGWKEGFVGKATVDAGKKSQAGYTLGTGEPVVLPDLGEETRFDTTPLLQEHGVVSGATVVIQGHHLPYGVLGVHTTRPRTFSEQEVHFLL